MRPARGQGYGNVRFNTNYLHTKVSLLSTVVYTVHIRLWDVSEPAAVLSTGAGGCETSYLLSLGY